MTMDVTIRWNNKENENNTETLYWVTSIWWTDDDEIVLGFADNSPTLEEYESGGHPIEDDESTERVFPDAELVFVEETP